LEDIGGNRLRVITTARDPGGGRAEVVSTLAGNGEIGYVDGARDASRFHGPMGISPRARVSRGHPTVTCCCFTDARSRHTSAAVSRHRVLARRAVGLCRRHGQPPRPPR
jgi:hypothetical protein